MNARNARAAREDVGRLLNAADRLEQALDAMRNAQADLAECRRALQYIAARSAKPSLDDLAKIRVRALDTLKLTEPRS